MLNIIVCVKEVPNPALPVEFDIQKNSVKDHEWNYILNPYDEVALEEALRLKDKYGGSVTVITLGSPRSEEILRKCLALGADRAIRIHEPEALLGDAFTTAHRLSCLISGLPRDIVLCGYRSIDRNGGEVGCMLAEFLGLPVVSAVAGLEMEAGQRSILVSRRLEKGAREIKRCPLPAVFTVDLLLNEPRYPTYPGVKAALKKSIEVIEPGALSGDSPLTGPAEALTRLTGITRPPPKKIFIPSGNLSPLERIKLLTQGSQAKKSSSNLLEGSPDDVARKAVKFLIEQRLLP